MSDIDARSKVKQAQLEMNIRNPEKFNILVWVKGTFGGHLWSAVMLMTILDGSHNQKSQTWLP